MKTTFEVGDKVQWNYGGFYGRPDDWRDGEVAEVDDDDPGLPYKIRVESGATYWCEPGNVRAAAVVAEPAAPTETVEGFLGFEPGWADLQLRQITLAHAVDLGKAVVAGGGHTDAETLVGIASKFEEFLRG